MMLSIIVPIYKIEEFLRQCVESILAQSLQEFELIIVDDGSTDNTGVIADRLHFEHPDDIKVIHKRNNFNLKENSSPPSDSESIFSPLSNHQNSLVINSKFNFLFLFSSFNLDNSLPLFLSKYIDRTSLTKSVTIISASLFIASSIKKYVCIALDKGDINTESKHHFLK